MIDPRIEAAARAIFLAHPLSDKSMIDACWDLYEDEARAAIATIDKDAIIETSPSIDLTNGEWFAFQSIPEQGYSHRAWIDSRITERVNQVIDRTVSAEAKVARVREVMREESFEIGDVNTEAVVALAELRHALDGTP